MTPILSPWCRHNSSRTPFKLSPGSQSSAAHSLICAGRRRRPPQSERQASWGEPTPPFSMRRKRGRKLRADTVIPFRERAHKAYAGCAQTQRSGVVHEELPDDLALRIGR